MRAAKGLLPAMASGQYAVIQVDVWKGRRLRRDGALVPTIELSREETGVIFDTLVAARGFAEAVVARSPYIECRLYDANGREVEVVLSTSMKRERHPVVHDL